MSRILLKLCDLWSDCWIFPSTVKTKMWSWLVDSDLARFLTETLSLNSSQIIFCSVWSKFNKKKWLLVRAKCLSQQKQLRRTLKYWNFFLHIPNSEKHLPTVTSPWVTFIPEGVVLGVWKFKKVLNHKNNKNWGEKRFGGPPVPPIGR